MRLLLSLALAGVAFAPATPAQDKKEEKPMLPSLDAKEWNKQKSGLEIWDAKEGKGDAVKRGAKVKVHYTGWLTNGDVFDSSVVRKEPIEFELAGLIKGWQEGIPGMKVGGVRRLKIPPELGYGDQRKGKIPANSVLVFEIEMLEATNPKEGEGPPDKEPEFPDLKAKEWKKLDNGLEVWDVKEGKGEAVKAKDEVTVYYVGWLTSGKKFDSNFDGKAITFGLNRVIKGWGEGLVGMKPGGVRRLKIPPELGYGKDGAGDDIPPNATLVFEVHLVK